MRNKIMIATILLGIAAIGAVNILISEASGSILIGMEYDDYIKSDASDASGSLELVELDGQKYLHAKSIGEGSYTENGTTIEVNVEKADLYVFLILGQSNGGYSNRANPNNVDVFVNPGEIYYFGDETQPPYGEWDPENVVYGMHDMMDSPTQAHIGGLEQPFAANFNKETGKKVYTINSCIGGSRTWTWRPENASYKWAQTLTDAGMSAIDTDKYTVHEGGIIWTQGENNPEYSIELYKYSLDELLAAMTHNHETYGPFNEDYVWDTMVISLIRQRGLNCCCAQIEYAQTHENVHLGCIICDHFTIENG